MNIIFVSNHMAKARTLNHWQVLALAFMLLCAGAMLAVAIILPQGGRDDQSHRLPGPLLSVLNTDTQAHLNALASQLGDAQARLMRLDALSARLAQLAGVREAELPPAPGRGGPLLQPHAQGAAELGRQLAQLDDALAARGAQLDMLEGVLVQRNLQRLTLPSGRPVDQGYHSSGFGWRTDPLTGEAALHQGLDFAAAAGSPIYAAADGVVAQADKVPEYGNIVKLDHGNGLESRYAHAARLLVKAGERVRRGQLIAEVGNSGRSTGPHLHFEVRLNGVALDPRRYLQYPKS